MHPLHDYIAKQLAEKLKASRVVVWYDVRSEFAPFVAELRGTADASGAVASVLVVGKATHLIEYHGSFFEIRAAAEPFVSSDDPEALLIYISGVKHDSHGSVLMELELAGHCYKPQLSQLAKYALEKKYTLAQIDPLMNRPGVSYEDFCFALADANSAEPPSILKAIFQGLSSPDALLAAWLAQDSQDAAIEAKDATRELAELVSARLGLALEQGIALPKLRAVTLRMVLAGEFRAGLKCAAPACLDSVPAPKPKDGLAAVRDIARKLRSVYAVDYARLADRVEDELGLSRAGIPAQALGSIDTFRFEERLLLTYCGELIAAQRFDDALALIIEHEHGFWLDLDVERKAQWEACRRMAELGKLAAATRAALTQAGNHPDGWVNAYAEKQGWHRLDQAQRQLEAWVANLDEEPDERPLAIVRQAYEEVCHRMAEGFAAVLAQAHWTLGQALHQTRIFSEILSARPKPLAYFFVDALRYEMGQALVERLPKSAEVTIRPAVAALPSITPIGMAALLPGASGSFSVVQQGGKLGVRIDDAFLPDLASRKKFAVGRIPLLVDLSLDELLSLQPSKLAKKLEGAQIIIVRSQEIDHAGETGFTFQARQVMDTVIDNLARAIRKLAAAGVENAVVTADHGHLFFATNRDESMRIDAPGGEPVELHRRCWIGRGGSTPPGCLRVSASALGYASDLEFVFPKCAGVFKAGGDLAFHHGGPSLQEMVIPVMTVRLQAVRSASPNAEAISISGLPEAITNRIFSVKLHMGGENLSLFANEKLVRPLLVSDGKQVGAVGMAIDAEFDRSTGCVKLHPDKTGNVALILSDESVKTLRVVVQDPATDAELYRSADIPVRLGI